MALPLLPAASRQRNVSDSGGDAASLPSPLLSPPLSCLAPVPGLPRCRCRLARPFPSGQARPSQARPGSTRRPQGGRRQRSAGLRGDEGGTRCPLGALWSHVLRRSSLRSRPRGGEANAGAAARPVPPPPPHLPLPGRWKARCC